MTHRADRPALETWRQHPADRPQSRADAEETARRCGGGNAGDRVETEWRQQALSIPFLPSRPPPSPLVPPRLAGGAGFKPGPLLAVLALESAFGGAKGSPARAPHRPADDGPGRAEAAEAAAVAVTKRGPKPPAQRKRDRAALVAGAVPMAERGMH